MRSKLIATSFVLILSACATGQDPYVTGGARYAPVPPLTEAEKATPIFSPLESQPNAGPLISSRMFIERPNGRDFANLYPPNALASETDGRVTLDCAVRDGGSLACDVVSETPAGRGFGDASLKIASRFRVAAQTEDGKSTAGGRIRIPITWNLQ